MNKIYKLCDYDEGYLIDPKGNGLFEKIIEDLKNPGTEVTLDFTGVQMRVSTWMNAVIGRLYDPSLPEDTTHRVKYVADDYTNRLIKRIADNAVQWYKNK